MKTNNDYEKLFSRLETPEPPTGLLEKIMFRLREERKLVSIKRRLVIFSFCLLGSALAFVPAFQAVQKGLAESGFLDFLSLLSSDASTILAYWQSFVLSLLETLPVMDLMAFLAVILIFLESLKFLAKDIKPFLIQRN